MRTSRPPPLRRPTRRFFDQPLAITRVVKRHKWLRLHRQIHEPMYFGSSGANRFDSPGFSTLYLAQQIHGSFVEVFCRKPQRRITTAQLFQYRVAEFEASRGLNLVDLAGKGLVKMGLDARLGSGSYRLAQKWAQAFHEHPDQVDGILYCSRHDPQQQLAAIFERSHPILQVTDRGSLREFMGGGFYELLDYYEIALV